MRSSPFAVVVNDDLTQLEVLSGLVRKSGLEARAFTGAEAALAEMCTMAQAADGNAGALPALIVTDLYMPGIDGWRFCRLLRSPEYGHLNHIPILVVSATFAGEAPGRIAADLGAEAFFASPVDGRRFAESVQAILKGQRVRSRARVLIVEDGMAVAASLQQAFEASGYTADTASTARVAADTFATAAYDVAVLDYHLPDGTGDTLLETFNAQRPACVCVMMTSDPGPELALDWMKRGAAAYLRKPFEPDYLVELCERARRERALLRVQDLLEVRTRELRESEEKHRILLEESPDPIFSLTPEGRYTFANRAFAEGMDKPVQDIVGSSLWDVFPKEEADRRFAHLSQACRTGERAEFEGRIPRADGDRYLVATIVPVIDAGGKVIAAIGSSRDITERRRAEEALSHSRDLMRYVIEHNRSAIAVHDRDLKYLYVSQRYLDDYKVKEQDVIGRHHYDVFPDLPQKWRDVHQKALAGEISSAEDDPYVRDDGAVDWTRWECRPWYEADGSIGGIIVYTEVITGRKRAEEALRESEARYRDLFDQANEGLFLMTTDGRLSEVNRAFADMHGYTVDELQAMDIQSLDVLEGKTLEDRDEIICRLQAGEVVRFEVEHRHKDGHAFPLAVTTSEITIGGRSFYMAFHQDITERRRAEEALRESEAKFSRAFQTSPYAIAITRVEDGGFVEINDAFTSMTGFTREEAHANSSIGLKLWVDEEDRQRVVSALGAGRAVVGQEIQFRTKSGKVIVGLYSAQMLRLSGNPCILSSIADVTEHKRAEAELRESQARLELAHRSAGAGTWDWDMTTQRLVWSREMYGLFGLDPVTAQATFDIWNQVLHPEDRDSAQRGLERAIHDRVQLSNEYRVVHPDGKVRWISALGDTTYDPSGRPVRMSGICTDITARKRAEEDYRTLFREMLDGFALHEIICDGAGTPVDYRFLEVNPAFERMTGLKAEDLQGRTVLEMMPDTERHWIESYGRVALTGEPVFFENTSAALQKHFAVTAFRPAPGQFACIFADITDRKRVEEDKARLEAQLRQAQKMESVGRLAGGVAHDFNNMLGVILGHAQLAMRRVGPEQPVHASLMEIHKAASRSADLTRQLLAFARRQTVAPRVLDLNETVTGMLQMLERLIGEDISLHWQPGADLWPVRVDPSQIDQVMANLCVNARDAISGVGKLTIETRNCAFNQEYCATHAGFVPGEYVLLVVSDNGCGMDKGTLAQLFEPFFTTKETGKGTGLGLATVYGIVKQNGGFIYVYSEPGSGSTFTIYLPRHVGRNELVRTEDAASPSAPSARGQETILLVEDEPAILEMTRTMLEMQGYAVLGAGAPGEAIRLAREHAGELQLLMTDVIMPEMNGRELARNLLSIHPHLKRLFMSGYTSDVIAHHGVLDEGVHFIQKPFSIEELAARVRETLDSE